MYARKVRVHHMRLVKSITSKPSRGGFPQTTLIFIPATEIILREYPVNASVEAGGGGMGLMGRKEKRVWKIAAWLIRDA